MTSSTIGGGTTSSGTRCPLPRGAGTEDEEPRQSASRRLRVEDMDACDIEQAGRIGDGLLEARAQRGWRPGGPVAEERQRGRRGRGGFEHAERGEQGGSDEIKDKI